MKTNAKEEARMNRLIEALGLGELLAIAARIATPEGIVKAFEEDPNLDTIPARRWELYHMDARLLFNAARNAGRLPADDHLAIAESVRLLRFVSVRHHAKITPNPNA